MSEQPPAPRKRSKPASAKPAKPGDTYNLAGDFRGAVVNIQSTIIGAAEVRELEALPPEPGDPPYQGLQYFDEADADRFFGRELLTARLVARLAQSHFLAVIGDSGSGKSSLVRAGVVPALRRGQRLADDSLPPSDSPAWDIRVLSPTAHPLESLAAALTREAEAPSALSALAAELAGGARALSLAARQLLARQSKPHLLLVIDQFEEVFAQCHVEEERQAFIDNLLTAADPQDVQPVTVLLLLRADFYAQVSHYDHLREMVSKQQEFIGAMSRDELFRAIVQPAALGNWKIQEGLVEVILDDIGAEPGALPLLSHALLETWKRRRARTMTLSGYHEAGGVRGAIARTAEAVFTQRLTPEQRPIARMIFLRLAELDQDAQDTRRRASFSELITRSTDPKTIQAVLDILTDARLVTTGVVEPGDTQVVEVAHEALIREWPTLRQWLAEDRDGLILHRQISDNTADWLRLERDPGALYRGTRLQQALTWGQANPNLLSLDEQAFLDASSQAAAAEAERERRYRQAALIRRWIAPVSAVVLVVLLTVLFFLTGLNNRFKTPATMNGAFNVAVAEFGQIGADGQVGAGRGGQTISGWVANKLQSELSSDPNLLVWHDGAELVRENVSIGRVEGATQAEKIAAAEALAARLKASMVVFGNIDTRQNPPQLLLEFWIAPQDKYHFEDIQGSYQSGAPIEIRDPASPGIEALPEINRQASTLAWLALGLTQASFGQSPDALATFRHAETFSPHSEVVQFFIGRESLFLSDNDTAHQQELTDQAREAFNKSLDLNPQYARAAVGLGSVYIAEAKRKVAASQTGGADDPILSEANTLAGHAMDAYTQAATLAAGAGEDSRTVELAANLGLGTSLRLQGEILERSGQDDESRRRLEEAVQTLTQIIQPLQSAGQTRYLAQAYETLGTAYQYLGYLDEKQGLFPESQTAYNQAVQSYTSCVELGNNSSDQIIRKEVVEKQCIPFRDDVQQRIGVNGGG